MTGGELQLIGIMGLVVPSFIFSLIALVLSAYCLIQLLAQKNSTHTVVPLQSPLGDLESQIKKLTSPSQTDLSRDLFNVGARELVEDDLV